jgi:NADP-dependent 3-hydroxy acid dehydrogenase YdfG
MAGTPKVAIITGASRGIGAGVASAFRAAGYAVVATALTIPSTEASNFATVAGDTADPQTAENVITCALTRFGRIDTLVNDAGIFIGKPFDEYTAEDLAAMVSVNLTGFFHMTQRAIVQMSVNARGT